MALLGKRLATADRPEEVERLPRSVAGHPAFVLTFHPAKWQLMPPIEEGAPAEWLPLLGELRFDPGVSGVGSTGSGAVDSTLARAAKAERKFVLIEPSDARLPEAFRDYIVRYENEVGRGVHVTLWQTFEVVGNRAYSSTDKAGYRAFLRSLITEKLVPAIHPKVRKMLEGDVVKAAERSASHAHRQNSPHAQGRSAQLKSRLSWLDTATTPKAGGDWKAPTPPASPKVATKKAA